MPIYEYRCPSCKDTKEIVRKITDLEEKPVCDACSDHPSTCPDGCFVMEMERVISSTSFILKGSGWAKDGYK